VDNIPDASAYRKRRHGRKQIYIAFEILHGNSLKMAVGQCLTKR
jgi:hypothetical protein